MAIRYVDIEPGDGKKAPKAAPKPDARPAPAAAELPPAEEAPASPAPAKAKRRKK